MYVTLSLTPVKPSGTPTLSKKRLYIQCSFVDGLSISITLFCTPFCLIDKFILSNTDSSVSSSASSNIHVVTPCNDFNAAV